MGKRNRRGQFAQAARALLPSCSTDGSKATAAAVCPASTSVRATDPVHRPTAPSRGSPSKTSAAGASATSASAPSAVEEPLHLHILQLRAALLLTTTPSTRTPLPLPL